MFWVEMFIASYNKSAGSRGATIVGAVLVSCILLAGIFAKNNPGTSSDIFAAKEKYPAKAFVIKRQGRLKSKTTYVGIAAGSGLNVVVNFDTSKQKLKIKIKDRHDKPLSRVVVEARASKVGRKQYIERFAMKETSAGEYRSETMSLKKGGWILIVTAYDLFDRRDNKLLFHTEQPIFLK